MDTPAEKQEELDDLELRLLLIGSEEEVGRGFELVDRMYRKRVTGWLRGMKPGMPSERLAIAWGMTLTALLESIRADRFDAEAPIEPWLRTVIARKAVDAYRDDSRAPLPSENPEAEAGHIFGTRWTRFTDAEKNELASIVRDAINTLPPKQRIVWRIFSGHLPHSLKMKYLRETVSEYTGEEETVAAIKGAFQAGRSKVAEVLRAAGYGTDLRDRT